MSDEAPDPEAEPEPEVEAESGSAPEAESDPTTGTEGEGCTEGANDGPAELTDRERTTLEALLFRLADDEFVIAERYVEWQLYAPTLESDLAVANIAQDELGHARLWYDLLEELGHTEPELLWERDPAAFRHATLCELPFAEGDWADAIVRSYLYDAAERIRLEALTDSAYAPIVDRVGKALSEERYHREHAANWLERLASGGERQSESEGEGSAETHARLQDALDRLFPHALTLFEPGPDEDAIVDCGFRGETLDGMRTEWLETVVPGLESLGLEVPDPEEAALPEAIGRDGTHTEAWFDLAEEFTRTYDELAYEQPVRLRGEQA